MNPEPTKFDQELGELIQLHRAACGMSQEQLAHRINVRPGLIAEYEAGARGVPLRGFCSIMSALEQNPAHTLATLQQRLFLADLEPGPASKGQSFLASNRGRQIVNALAMCNQPEALDALADLIMSIGVHACVDTNVADERVQQSDPT